MNIFLYDDVLVKVFTQELVDKHLLLLLKNNRTHTFYVQKTLSYLLSVLHSGINSMTHQLNMICQYTAGNTNMCGQRTNRKKKRRDKSADYQLGHTSFGNERQCHSWYLNIIFYSWIVLYFKMYFRTEKGQPTVSVTL